MSLGGRTTHWATAGWTTLVCSVPACIPSASAAARRECSHNFNDSVETVHWKCLFLLPTSQGASARGFPRVVSGAGGAG